MNHRHFAYDDYSHIYAKYFADLWDRGIVDADPSGWLLTSTEAEKFIRLPLVCTKDFVSYTIDDGNSMCACKDHISTLLTAWEGRSISPDQFTLCPSGGCASLATLVLLKRLGIARVLFETPAYFATIEQAKEIGLPFTLLPTYRDDDYAIPSLKRWLRKDLRTALWITQPRASLGFNQSCDSIKSFIEQVGSHGYVVADEVTDQSVPAHCAQICNARHNLNFIRIRSFTKGMGLNGFRLAAIIHPAKLRSDFVDCMETVGGAIDAFSLRTVTTLAKDIPRFRMMLTTANAQVNSLRAKAQRLVIGSPLTVNHLTNGYIGSMTVDLRSLGRSQTQRRKHLLEWCRKVRTPVILGASFYMAKAPPTESIRLNFFNQPYNVTRGVANILGLWS